MKNFSDLGLADCLLQAVSAEGYDSPTPIQEKSIPALLGGRNLLGIAQTGTGKTASFTLPILHDIAGRKSRPPAKCCGALILVPTRELAIQIADNIRSYGRFMRHSRAIVVGGAKPGPQIRALSRGVDICVATPGRLLDHLSSGAVRLDKTTTVVLDEADQMLDLGFLPPIQKIMAKLPRDVQTVLLSATMPKQIRGLADEFLKNPVEVSVAPQSTPIERIDQKVILADQGAKRALLVDVLKNNPVERAIVFTRTKYGADKVCQHLHKAGFKSDALHGNKSQGQRQRTLEAFRTGRVSILVATDIAARGIDVDGITHVVNFELPNVPEAYVHRIGRTARAGKSGHAITFCDASERRLLRDIEKLIGLSIEAQMAVGSGDDFALEAVSVEAMRDHRGSKHRPQRRRKGPNNSGSGKPRRERRGADGQDRPARAARGAEKKSHEGAADNRGKPRNARAGQKAGQKAGQSQGRPPKKFHRGQKPGVTKAA
ncbi:MAG: DEAD/DEAH box helicase [Kordiimonas sp.]|nr:DEAD/DEAH box helicase [Kordiimonas sp.]